MLMEIMGLHLPGSAFIQPEARRLRDALVAGRGQSAPSPRPGAPVQPALYADGRRSWTEKTLVNGILAGLLATGGSTNHTLHLVAMARAAGIVHRLARFR
jgi:phosphogluconate dehydratase